MADKKEKFVIEVPNSEFSGYRFGIKFQEGRAVVNSREVRDFLVKDHGYKEVKPTEE